MPVPRINSALADSVYSRCNDVLTVAHVAFLYEHSNLMYAFMTQLVTPVYSEDVERAAVTFNMDGRAYLFEVNEEFWKGINFYEQCFVLAHEILHPLLNHCLRGNDYVKELRKRGSNFWLMTEDVLNQMMDIEINEALVSNAYGFHRALLSFQKDTCFVDTVFPSDIVESESIKVDEKFEYYCDIYMKHVEEGAFSHLFDLIFNGMGYLMPGELIGSPGDHQAPQHYPEIDQEEQRWEDIRHAEEDVLNDFFDGEDVDEADILGNKITIQKGSWGTGSSGNYTITLDAAKSLDDVFDINMRRVNQRKKASRANPTWAKINRRLHATMQAIDPSISIPSVMREEYKVEDKLKILVYMDTSQSCLRDVKKLMELVKGLPKDKYEIETYIFAGHVGPIDLERPKFFSGGTEIDKVYRHAVARFAEQGYDGVFVLTDGEFSNCHSRYNLNFENWSWFLVPTYDESGIPAKSKVNRVK